MMGKCVFVVPIAVSLALILPSLLFESATTAVAASSSPCLPSRTSPPFGVHRSSPHAIADLDDNEDASSSSALLPSPLPRRRLSHVPLRGGGSCQDADMTLFVKIGLTAAVQSASLLAVLLLPSSDVFSSPVLDSESASGAGILRRILPALASPIGGISILQWTSFLLVIFASSFLGNLVDGAASAASAQVLAPNVTPGDPDWYAGLKRPNWEPPGWVFPIMWLIVSKPTQLLALATLWRNDSVGLSTGNAGRKTLTALAAYCAHLSLGDAWNKVFFGFQCPGRGAAVISCFLGVLYLSAYLFYGVDERAGLFLLPTCGWVSVAAALNWSIYLNNRPSATGGGDEIDGKLLDDVLVQEGGRKRRIRK